MKGHAPKATIEEWRPTHHPSYDVSNIGRVRSRARGNEKILKSGIASHGYPTVCFGRGNTISIHVLVAAAFIGPCPDGCEVRHKNDDRTDARADNLEYGTRAANVADMMARQRRKYGLSPREVRLARRLSSSHTYDELAAKFNVCSETIGRAVRRITWKHVI